MDRNLSPWHAVRVRSRFENIVTANLTCQGLAVFYPTYVARRERDGRTSTIDLPLFPGYVFCRIGASSKSKVLLSAGVLFVAGDSASRQSVVENEISALQSLTRSSLHYEAAPLTSSGLRVQVIDGALRNVEGTLIEPAKARLALPVSLVQRSVFVDLAEGTEVVPVLASDRKAVAVPA
jgi:transcription antitermination factor NusG